MSRTVRSVNLLISGLLLASGSLFLAFGVDRTDFWQVLLGFCTAFAGYGWIATRQPNDAQLRYWLGLGLLLRFAFIFAFPLLSDDVYRFIWDGQLIRAGLNPFAELPAYYLENGNAVPGLTQELYSRLNSPEYYTIYPPVAQGAFTLAALLSPNSWFGAAVVMKVCLFAAECGSLILLWRLLPKFGLARNRILLYWLNPLILVEIMGNLHFEGAMIAFLLLALLAFINGRWILAAAGFALSVASKLLPLMFLPFLIWRLWAAPNASGEASRGRPFWLFSIAFGGFTLLLFAPLLSSGFAAGFGSSLDLYFRKFEFNASFYYLLRAYGYYEIGWNQIARFGPILAQMAGVYIMFLAAEDGLRNSSYWSTDDSKLRWGGLPGWWLFAFTIYLFCATTVHPWYLGLPIVLCCFGPWRYPLVWSFLIVLTYTSYTRVPYTENLWLVAVEYSAVIGFMLYEWRKRTKAKKLPTG